MNKEHSATSKMTARLEGTVTPYYTNSRAA